MKNLFVAVALITLLTILSCGGGGGSAGSTASTGTNTTTSTTSTTSTNSGTSSGVTAATTGTAGNLPQNMILFSVNDGTSNTIREMAPDGTNQSVLDTLPTNYSGYARSPASNLVAFAYSASGTTPPSYAVYVNSTVSVTGATLVDAGPYVSVNSLQFTPDGSKLIYVATSLSAAGGLTVANANGAGTPVVRDSADDASLSPSGTVIVYSKSPSGTGEICRRKVDGTGFAQLTHNSDDDILPQWSKEGDRIYFSSDRTGFYNIWSMDISGQNLHQVTLDSDRDFSPSPNTGDTLVAYAKLSANQALTGIYTTDPAGTSPGQIFADPNVRSFLYWTGTNGRAQGSAGLGSLDISPRVRRVLFGR